MAESDHILKHNWNTDIRGGGKENDKLNKKCTENCRNMMLQIHISIYENIQVESIPCYSSSQKT